MSSKIMRDSVIVDAVRTPIGRRKGCLAGVHPVDLLGGVLQNLAIRNHLDAHLVDDVIVGCVDQVGEQGANIGRNAWLSAGLPESVPAVTIDRQCGSSLQAATFAAEGVMAGTYDIAIAAGVESMTRVPMWSTLNGGGTPVTKALKERYELQSAWFDQALGAQLIAKKWGFSREALDEFSLRSHQRAAAARTAGKFESEIVPVDAMGDDGQHIHVTEDEGIRPSTTLEKLAALTPPFPGIPFITAGNASQISDGASAALICTPEIAESFGWRARARFCAFAVVGVDPITMLTGPIPATHKVLKNAGLTVDDIDVFEVNEAFAPVVLAWQKEFGVPWDKVNIHGGAIALGHPLGATGTRILATLLNALEQTNGRYGLAAICEGGGMANAVIIERIEA